jgi:hypothetical protein
MSDASVRAVCKTTREGFDEAFGSSSSSSSSIPTPRRDKRAYLLAAGVCRMAKELNGQIKIKLHHPSVTKNSIEVNHCIAPSVLYDLFIDEFLEATPERRFELRVTCGSADDETDTVAKATALERAYGCVRRAQSLTRVRWWKEGNTNLGMHMMSNVTYKTLINQPFLHRDKMHGGWCVDPMRVGPQGPHHPVATAPSVHLVATAKA